MKEPWCLAVGGATITGATAVKLCARRSTIEETFRDTKDPQYGLGLWRPMCATSADATACS